MRHYYTDGQLVPEGVCVKGTDHVITTFTVEVRSSNPLSAEALKAIIETRHEVTNIGIKDRRYYHPR